MPPAHILIVVPHCDDADYYCGGAIARWSAEGKRIALAVMTDGAKGMLDPNGDAGALIATRRDEQRRATAQLGIVEVEFFDYIEGDLDVARGLGRDIVRLVRKHRPETIITLDPRADAIPPGGINHPDHRYTGRAVLDAVYPAAHLPTFFPELLEEGLEPHHAAEILLAATDAPDEFVDIGATFDRKCAALREHQSQFGDGDGVVAEARVIAEFTGQRAGLALAEGFRRIVNSW